MQPVKLEQNWTRFPNNILDNLHLFTPQEFVVIGYMVRQWEGFRERNNKFSIQYLVNNTGLTRPTVVKAVKGLRDKKAIIEVESGPRGRKSYELNWDESQVKEADRLKNLTRSSQRIKPDPVKDFNPLKETIQTNNTKNGVAHPAHGDLMKWFYNTHNELRGFYPILSGKDGKALKDLLKDNTEDVIREKGSQLLTDLRAGKVFYAGEPFTPHTLKTHWNRIQIEKAEQYITDFT